MCAAIVALHRGLFIVRPRVKRNWLFSDLKAAVCGQVTFKTLERGSVVQGSVHVIGTGGTEP